MRKGLVITVVILILMNLHCSERKRDEAIVDAPGAYVSNGERIYFTGISSRTGRIEVRGGPLWLRTHGGGCVACHGTRGKGGIAFMDTAVSADIRYKALTLDEHFNGEGNVVHRRYTDELIHRAITEGLDSEGKPLHWIMPQWIMPEKDLDDLIDYLKTLE
jgi:mono/diheme cytochrome c family protein